MLAKNKDNSASQMQIVSIEQLVPEDHLLRKIDAAVTLQEENFWSTCRHLKAWIKKRLNVNATNCSNSLILKTFRIKR